MIKNLIKPLTLLFFLKILLAQTPVTPSIWDIDNLVAWESSLRDTTQRSPIERAQMLKELGFQHYAYLPSADPFGKKTDVNSSHLDAEAEIQAMLAEGINISAWMFWINRQDADQDPKLLETLALFKKYNLTPSIWITHSFEKKSLALPKNEQAQLAKIETEAKRIKTVADLANEYGCDVGIYTLKNWLGLVDNQIAVQKKLREWNVNNVGTVYNFSHCSGGKRNKSHNDPANFSTLWPKLQPYVTQINLSSIPKSGPRKALTPKGHELNMMRIIEDSQWQGKVGILTYTKTDAKKILSDSLYGIKAITAELSKD